MMSETPNSAGQYARNATVCALGAIVGSIIGSLATWVNDGWADANPLSAGPTVAALSLGPTVLVLGASRFKSRRSVWTSAAVLALVMLAMWIAFASSDSSTSAFVFLWGWIVVLPVAIGVVAASRRSTSGTEPRPN